MAATLVSVHSLALICTCLSLFFACCAPVDAAVVSEAPGPIDASTAIELKLTDIHGCFMRSIRAHKANDASVRPSSSAELFFLDQLPSDPRAILALDAQTFCTTIAERYTSAYDHTVIALLSDPSTANSLGTPGTRPIDSHSLFIKYGHAASTASHVAGHSDITRDAITNAMHGITPEALDLFMRAAQAPDFYCWSRDAFHAQTVAYKPGARDAAIEQSISEFDRLLKTSFEAFRAAAEQPPSTDVAILQLGSLLHPIQDLAYHRGMSFAQHSGLSYYIGDNPDMLSDPEKAKRVYAQAVDYTSRLLMIARRRVSDRAWSRMIEWRPPGGWNYDAVARRIFNSDEDLTETALVKYWLASFDYRLGRRPATELDEAKRGMWDADQRMLAVEQLLSK